jgi:hypothetical protein
MLAVLGGLADVERDLIRTRTAEGRSRAKAQGAHMGRPSSLTPAQQKEATRRRAGRYVAGIGRQLRPQHFHHAPRHARSLSSSGPTRAFIGHDLFHRAVIAERPACPRCNVARGASPNSFLRLFCTAIRHPALLDLVFGTVK